VGYSGIVECWLLQTLQQCQWQVGLPIFSNNALQRELRRVLEILHELVRGRSADFPMELLVDTDAFRRLLMDIATIPLLYSLRRWNWELRMQRPL